MIAALETVQPPLEKVYSLQNEEKRAQLNALAEDQRRISAAKKAKGLIAQGCGVAQPAAMQWPTGEIEARLRPTDAQRASLQGLQDASAKAADMLKASCPAGDAVTPPARLAAARNRLEAMLQAVKLVKSALEDFYPTLTDEQKPQFEPTAPTPTPHLAPRRPAG